MPCICLIPLKLDEEWNHISIDLDYIAQKAYSSRYMETKSVQIHANCRLRRVYFSDRIFHEDDLPPEFRLYKSLKSADTALQCSPRAQIPRA